MIASRLLWFLLDKFRSHIISYHISFCKFKEIHRHSLRFILWTTEEHKELYLFIKIFCVSLVLIFEDRWSTRKPLWCTMEWCRISHSSRNILNIPYIENPKFIVYGEYLFSLPKGVIIHNLQAYIWKDGIILRKTENSPFLFGDLPFNYALWI